MESRSDRLTGRRAISDSLAARRDSVRERIETVRSLDRGRLVWPRLLDGLDRALPDGAWLTSLETESPAPGLAVRVEGRAATPHVITDFVRRLRSASIVEAVEIRGSTREATGRGHVQAFVLLVRCRS